jgi:hypothetical protein
MFKMVYIKQLTHKTLDMVTINNWKKCVRHVEEIQTEDNKKKKIMRDIMIESIFITLLSDDSDWSDDKNN